MRFILPKTHPNLEAYRDVPIFFLAGPIMGAGDWHLSMSAWLMQYADPAIVVNPSRYQPPHTHLRFRMEGDEKHFERQTDWERHYMEQAAAKWPWGALIFWLAEQTGPRSDGEPYARDTRGEIGEWRGRMMCVPGLRVVIGAEKGFPGLSQIKRNFELAVPGLTIHDTMEAVAREAARLAVL